LTRDLILEFGDHELLGFLASRFLQDVVGPTIDVLGVVVPGLRQYMFQGCKMEGLLIAPESIQ